MSTNFYAAFDNCTKCERKELLHIGKTVLYRGEPTFLMRGYTNLRIGGVPALTFGVQAKRIDCWDDWLTVLSGADFVVDEYDDQISVEEFVERIDNARLSGPDYREFS